MEPKRLGGAFLTAFATGVGIIAPYTFKSVSPAFLAVIWACLVFLGVCGLVLALKPGGSSGGVGNSAAQAAPQRRSSIDPEIREVASFYVILAMMIGGPLLILFGLFALFRLAIFMLPG